MLSIFLASRISPSQLKSELTMSCPTHITMLDAAGRTPTNSAMQFTYVCDTLLGLTPGNILLLAFDRAGLQTTMDLAAVTDGMINFLIAQACRRPWTWPLLLTE
jgi:hypothetical protein